MTQQDAQPSQASGGTAIAEESAGAYGDKRARLIENYNYDLVQELAQLLKGVWRIDEYLKDAGGRCDACGSIWNDVRKQNELLIEKIRQEIVNHAKDGRFV
jgi:hypothetical protein